MRQRAGSVNQSGTTSPSSAAAVHREGRLRTLPGLEGVEQVQQVVLDLYHQEFFQVIRTYQVAASTVARLANLRMQTQQRWWPFSSKGQPLSQQFKLDPLRTKQLWLLRTPQLLPKHNSNTTTNNNSNRDSTAVLQRRESIRIQQGKSLLLQRSKFCSRLLTDSDWLGSCPSSRCKIRTCPCSPSVRTSANSA